MRTTSEGTMVKASACGPAEYTGGAPKPYPPVDEPTPAEQREIEKHRQHLGDLSRIDQAREEFKQKKAQKKSFTERARSAVHIATATAGAKVNELHCRLDDRFRSRSAESDKKWFHEMYPHSQETFRNLYKCTYVDGRGTQTKGKLAVTNVALHFVLDQKGEREDTIPFKSVACLESEPTPGQLNVYTVAGKVYQYTEFVPMDADDTPASTLAHAHNWIDHSWRRAAIVPNPAATYFES
ncbi:hypothetical protein DIPPA_25640 [Diplonema papillatum]|nr:hypothetical protein DIPPA_25640 [Diplonema papillatum]